MGWKLIRFLGTSRIKLRNMGWGSSKALTRAQERTEKAHHGLGTLDLRIEWLLERELS